MLAEEWNKLNTSNKIMVALLAALIIMLLAPYLGAKFGKVGNPQSDRDLVTRPTSRTNPELNSSDKLIQPQNPKGSRRGEPGAKLDEIEKLLN